MIPWHGTANGCWKFFQLPDKFSWRPASFKCCLLKRWKHMYRNRTLTDFWRSHCHHLWKKTWKRFKWLADHRFWSLFSSQMIQTCLGWTRLTFFFKKSTHFWHQFLFQMLSNLTCSSIWKAQLTHKALGLYLEETGGGGGTFPQKKTPANHKQIDEVKNATSRFHLWQVDLE